MNLSIAEISKLFISKIGNMEVEIITPKLSDKREDSFWYWNKGIAKIELENKHTLLLEVGGDINYVENKKEYKNQEALDLLLEYDYDDRDLVDLHISGDVTQTNHFLIVEIDENDIVVGDCLGVCHEYEEGIEMLKELAFLDEEQ